MTHMFILLIPNELGISFFFFKEYCQRGLFNLLVNRIYVYIKKIKITHTHKSNVAVSCIEIKLTPT